MSGRKIRVRVNGDEREISGGLTIDRFLLSLDLNPRLVVVERNGDILRRDAYTETEVESGDTLELVHFVGGG